MADIKKELVKTVVDNPYFYDDIQKYLGDGTEISDNVAKDFKKGNFKKHGYKEIAINKDQKEPDDYVVVLEKDGKLYIYPSIHQKIYTVKIQESKNTNEAADKKLEKAVVMAVKSRDYLDDITPFLGDKVKISDDDMDTILYGDAEDTGYEMLLDNSNRDGDYAVYLLKDKKGDLFLADGNNEELYKIKQPTEESEEEESVLESVNGKTRLKTASRFIAESVSEAKEENS